MGKGHQILQSLTALGSGGWFGSGLGRGTSKLSFLPDVGALWMPLLPTHMRGELLGGLADVEHRLGNREQSRSYFERHGTAVDREAGVDHQPGPHALPELP